MRSVLVVESVDSTLLGGAESAEARLVSQRKVFSNRKIYRPFGTTVGLKHGLLLRVSTFLGSTMSIANAAYPDIDLAAFTSGSTGFRMIGSASNDHYNGAGGVGDVNGDGIDDVILSGQGADPFGRSNAGAAMVIYGHSTATTFTEVDPNTFAFGTNGFEIYGAVAGDNIQVAGCGDVNGDGIADLVAGGQLADPGGVANAGAAWVIFGRPTSDPFPAVIDLLTFTSGSAGYKISGGTSGDFFAYTYSGMGDVNGDGYAEVIVSAYGARPFGRAGAGAVYVIFGHNSSIAFTNLTAGAFASSAVGITISGGSANDHLVGTWSPPGDVNGDGIDDIIVSAPFADPPSRSNAGIIYIIYGHTGAFADIDLLNFPSAAAVGFTIYGQQTNAYESYYASISGDINDDGCDDIVAGAHLASPVGITQAGWVTVIFGRRGTPAGIDFLNGVPSSLGFRIYSSVTLDNLGNSVAIVGDVTMDGIDDLLIGVIGYDAFGRTDCGMVMVIFGHSNKTAFPDIYAQDPLGELGYKIYGALAGDKLGVVGIAKDLNNDNKTDLVVSAYSATVGARSQTGAGYAIFGSNPPPTPTPSTWPTSQPSCQPSCQPSRKPSSRPSGQPSCQPSSKPSGQPSQQPTSQPTRKPSSQPSAQPSQQPTVCPSRQPSGQPSSQPTNRPVAPSSQPSRQPTTQPSSRPNRQPSSQPSVEPSAQPSSQPSMPPSLQPMSRPSGQPTSQPSTNPSAKPITPTAKPTASPTAAPSMSAAHYARLLSSPTRRIRNGFAFAVLASDGSVHTWGEAPHGGDSTAVSSQLLGNNITTVMSTRFAFAAIDSVGRVVAAWGAEASVHRAFLLANTAVHHLVANEAAFAGIDAATGGVVAFGSEHDGGDVLHDSKCNGYSTQLSTGVTSITASAAAFAAVKSDGTVYAWGHPYAGAGVSSEAMPQLAGVSKVVASREAFAALLSTGRVVTWGGEYAGGDSSAVASELQSGVVHIVASSAAFVAIKNDERAVPWGYGPWGGDAFAVTDQLTQIVYVGHTAVAFAVLRSDGSVVAWGDADSGGDYSAVQTQLVNVEIIYGNSKAFAALTSVGNVVTWGKAAYGGQIPSNKVSALSSGVVSIYHTDRAFAAHKSNGQVVVWGQAGHGGSPGAAVEAHLVSGVHTVCSNDAAFSAIKTDGSVVGWGHPVSFPSGGITHNISNALLPVICA